MDRWYFYNKLIYLSSCPQLDPDLLDPVSFISNFSYLGFNGDLSVLCFLLLVRTFEKEKYLLFSLPSSMWKNPHLISRLTIPKTAFALLISVRTVHKISFKDAPSAVSQQATPRFVVHHTLLEWIVYVVESNQNSLMFLKMSKHFVCSRIYKTTLTQQNSFPGDCFCPSKATDNKQVWIKVGKWWSQETKWKPQGLLHLPPLTDSVLERSRWWHCYVIDV